MATNRYLLPTNSPIEGSPNAVSPQRQPTATGNNMSSVINSAIPGFSNLTSSASQIINDLLSNEPSPANARLENAWYGAGTGLDSRSGFLNNRGYDLYRREAADNKQTGIKDLLALLSGVSGTVVPTAGQSIQDSQFQQTLARQMGLDAEERQRRIPVPTTARPWYGAPRTGDTSLPSSIGGYAPAGFTRYF